MHAPSIRSRVLELRKAGYSYSFISEKTGISKSTLSGWLGSVPYVPNEETVSFIGKARAASGQAKSLLKQESITLAHAEVLKEMGTISKRDLFMLGLGLFIGEGSKDMSLIRFVNSNPFVLKFMIRWFTEVFGLRKDNIVLRLHIYPDCNENESIKYWADTLDMPVSQFQKTQIDRRDNKKAMKAGKLPHGTVHLSIKSLGEKRFGVFFARKLQAASAIVLGGL